MSEKPSWLLFLYGSNDEFEVHEELSHRVSACHPNWHAYLDSTCSEEFFREKVDQGHVLYVAAFVLKWYAPGELTPMGPKPAGPPYDWAHSIIFQDRSTGKWHALTLDEKSRKSLSASYEWLDNLLPGDCFSQLDIAQFWGSNLLIDRCVTLYKCTKAYTNAEEQRHEELAVEATRDLKRNQLAARRKEVERAREIEEAALQ